MDSLMTVREEVVALRESKSENEQLIQQLQAKLEMIEIDYRRDERNIGNIRKLMDE